MAEPLPKLGNREVDDAVSMAANSVKNSDVQIRFQTWPDRVVPKPTGGDWTVSTLGLDSSIKKIGHGTIDNRIALPRWSLEIKTAGFDVMIVENGWKDEATKLIVPTTKIWTGVTEQGKTYLMIDIKNDDGNSEQFWTWHVPESDQSVLNAWLAEMMAAGHTVVNYVER